MTAKSSAALLISFFSFDQSKKAFEVSRGVIAVADRAITARRSDILKRVSNLLSSLPLSHTYEHIARYYGAIAEGGFVGASDIVKKQLEGVADQGPVLYRARALMSLGAIALRKGNYDEAYSLYDEAETQNTRYRLGDPLIGTSSIIVKALGQFASGDPDWSLKTLKQGFDYARSINKQFPAQFLNYINCLAVVLSEIGHISAALYFINLALASPYAFAFPEWSETGSEISHKMQCCASRSIVSVCKIRTFHALSSPLQDGTITLASPFLEGYDSKLETSAELDRGHRTSNIVTEVGQTGTGDNLLLYQPKAAEEQVPNQNTAPARVFSLEARKRVDMAKGQRKEDQQEEKSDKQLKRELVEGLRRNVLTREQVKRIISIINEGKQAGTH